MEISSRFKTFVGVAALLICTSLVFLNDLMTVWSGTEAALLWDVLAGENTATFPLLLFANLEQDLNVFPFWSRTIGGGLFLFSIIGFYYIAKPFLGQKTALLSALLTGAGFLLPILAKFATLDIWVFSFHFLAFFTLVRYLKEPKIHWQLLYYVLVALSLLTAPISSLVFLFGTATYVWRKHPQGGRLFKLNPWIAFLVLGGIFYFSGVLKWENDWQILPYTPSSVGKYLLYNLIGILPFIGFVLGGLRDLIYKIKKGEELALLITGLLLFAVLSLSPVLQAGLAWLIAKQMLVYYDKNYPFKNWVRVGTILHLIFAFIVSMGVMLGGFVYFQGIGFRSGMVLCLTYWATGLFGVFALYGGENRSMLIGGPILSAIFTMLIFWLQLYPLIESHRNIPKDLMEVVGEKPVEKIFIVEEAQTKRSSLELYTKKHYPKAEIIISSPNTIQRQWTKAINAVLFLQMTTETAAGKDTIVRGWNDHFDAVFWTVEMK